MFLRDFAPRVWTYYHNKLERFGKKEKPGVKVANVTLDPPVLPLLSLSATLGYMFLPMKYRLHDFSLIRKSFFV